MKNLKLLLLPIMALCACSGKTGKAEIAGVKGLVDKFADVECRAVSLREKRFELANQLRFTQDTLMARSLKPDTTRLKLKLDSLTKDKGILLQQSLALADSIKHSLDDLMKNRLTTQQDKDAFNEMLNKALIERGCAEKP